MSSRSFMVYVPRPDDLRFLVGKALAHNGRHAHLLLRGSKGRAFLLPPRTGEKRGRFKEFWAGYGDLTTAVGKHGVATAASVDAYPAGHYEENADLTRAEVLFRELGDIYYGDIRAAHLGITCRTWGFRASCSRTWAPGRGRRELCSAMVGTPTRSPATWRRPQPCFSCRLSGLWAASARWNTHGGLTYLFQHPGLRLLGGSGEFNTIIIDQCEYGLRPSDDPLERYQKTTSLFGNLPGLDFLGRRCRGEHEHVVILGKVPGTTCNRSTEAGRYPAPLCRQMGRLLAQALKAKGWR